MNDVDRKKLKGALQELSDSMTRMDAEKDLQKDIIQVTFENHAIDKKHIRKLAMIYHKQIIDEVRTNNTEVEDLYEDIFNVG